jgi:hypothetical protein
MTNAEAIRILCGKAPLVIRDRAGNAYDKTEELKTAIITALTAVESIQDFSDMVNDHADENWTGEEIIQALVHRGLYHTERGTDET